MKGKSTHLVDVPSTSNHSEPDYFNEHGDPVYAHTHMVNVKEINCKETLDSVSNQCRFQESEELCGKVSYCSVES